MKPDLTEALLRLSAGERSLIVDLYQCRFVRSEELSVLSEISRGEPGNLLAHGFLRSLQLDEATVYWLTRRGERAAVEVSGIEPSAGRAYAALRLAHELLRSALYIALRRRGMPAVSYRCEPRLGYRSAAGLGERTIVPDALVEAPGKVVLVEVDRGTESSAQLRHKWLRYREWLLDQTVRPDILLLAPGTSGRPLDTARAAGLDVVLFEDPAELSSHIWPKGDAPNA